MSLHYLISLTVHKNMFKFIKYCSNISLNNNEFYEPVETKFFNM